MDLIQSLEGLKSKNKIFREEILPQDCNINSCLISSLPYGFQICQLHNYMSQFLKIYVHWEREREGERSIYISMSIPIYLSTPHTHTHILTHSLSPFQHLLLTNSSYSSCCQDICHIDSVSWENADWYRGFEEQKKSQCDWSTVKGEWAMVWWECDWWGQR